MKTLRSIWLITWLLETTSLTAQTLTPALSISASRSSPDYLPSDSLPEFNDPEINFRASSPTAKTCRFLQYPCDISLNILSGATIFMMFKFSGTTPMYNEHLFMMNTNSLFKIYRYGRSNKLVISTVNAGTASWFFAYINVSFEQEKVYRLGLVFNPALPGNKAISVWIDAKQVSLSFWPTGHGYVGESGLLNAYICLGQPIIRDPL